MTRSSSRPRRKAFLAVLGGTFDRLHAGHYALLAQAFRAADRVGIGLTTARFLRAHPKPLARRIRSYEVRRRGLERFLARRYARGRWYVVPLDDPWGGSVEPGVDMLVVSPETATVASTVNRERKRRGLPALRIRVIEPVLADDLRPVASRRIRSGEIDVRGHRRRPVRVGVIGWRGGPDVLARALRASFSPVAIELESRPSIGPAAGTSSTPGRVRDGASRRALSAVRGRDFGIGIAAPSLRLVPRRARDRHVAVAVASAEALSHGTRPEAFFVARLEQVPVRIGAWFHRRRSTARRAASLSS